MAKKSYDQRLQKRWLRKEQKEKYRRKNVLDFYGLRELGNWTMAILPFLFGKRNR